MKVAFFDLRAQYRDIKADVDQAIHAVLESGLFVGGDLVHEFESAFSSLIGAPHCVGVANGTDALYLALKSLGVKSGDEVITPAFSWISSAETISLAMGKPVFADVLPAMGTINPADIKKKINPRTKGVIAVHLYGQAAYAHEIRDLCQKNGLFLIEDCAQAHMTTEDGVHVGTIGNVGTFSFYPTKNLGAYGDAGCLITSDEILATYVRHLADHGGRDVHRYEGINSRLDTLQAAILSAKCKYLPMWTQQRIDHATRYTSRLKELSAIELVPQRAGCISTFHQYVIWSQQRDQLRAYLHDHQIETRIHYSKALLDVPAYHHVWTHQDFPVARRCADTALSLPVYPELTNDQIDFVCETIHDFHRRNK